MKKIISFIVLMAICVSMVNAFSGGTGYNPDPYLISTPQELQDMETCLDCDYKLLNSLNMEGFDYGDGKGFMPVGDATNKFTGSLDGNGKVISNLYINRTKTYIGLIGEAEDSYIKDIGIKNINILVNNGNAYSGGIVGYGKGISINSSYVIGNFTNGIGCDTQSVGGILGIADNFPDDVSLNNVYSIVNMTLDCGINIGSGGLIGYDNGFTLNNSYSSGYMFSTRSSTLSRTGGIYGRVNGFRTNYIYNTFGNIFIISPLTTPYGIGVYNGFYSVNSFFNNFTDDNINNCHSTTFGTCTAIQDNEAYFYDLDNEPMASWDTENVWCPYTDDLQLPILKWQSECDDLAPKKVKIDILGNIPQSVIMQILALVPDAKVKVRVLG